MEIKLNVDVYNQVTNKSSVYIQECSAVRL